MRSTSSHPSAKNRFRQVFAVVVLVASVFWSCRTIEDPEDFSGWQNYVAKIPTAVGCDLWPETVRWRSGPDSGVVRVPAVDTSLAVTIAFWGSPQDTIWIDLWKADVRYAKAGFVFQGSSTLKLVAQRDDSVAIGILSRIRPAATAKRFDSAYAQALVDGDALVKASAFPKSFPEGVDTSVVLREAMLRMVAKQVPLSAIVKNWAMGIDTLGVHSRIRSLAEQGFVADTSMIFPAYPVRAVSAIGLDSVLESRSPAGSSRIAGWPPLMSKSGATTST